MKFGKIMFKATIMYPPTPSGRFDMTYYVDKHMPMVKEKIGDSCVGFTVESGIAGGAPGSPAPYVAIGALLFESMEIFGATMAQHGAEIMADIANYTDSHPVTQISEVKAG
jgi:uncharacterized protein (TIGR02118 family)